ncbi:MAG: tRNA epoxyqueuosine(34) reductase QueG [Rhodospirillales bacterium]
MTAPPEPIQPGIAGGAATEVKERIRRAAVDVGFDAVGFGVAEGDREDADHLAAYLADGRHGEMTWMETTAARRADPRALWPDARTIVALGVNYGPVDDPLATLDRGDRGTISVYARGRDYHEVVKKRLKRLGRWMAETFACGVKVFVDTAPVMEKPVAMRAGLGWIGKHTNLVSRHFGSWLFLGEVFTTLALPADAAETDHCGTCDRCLRACPTGALPAPYRIDPRRCISYLTIEHRGTIDDALAPAMGNRVYGCDDCLAVCPWNRFATPSPHPAFAPRPPMTAAPLAELADLDDASFRARFTGSAIKRSGRDRLVRNALVAIGNSRQRTLALAAQRRCDDAAAEVRDAARRATARLDAEGS